MGAAREGPAAGTRPSRPVGLTRRLAAVCLTLALVGSALAAIGDPLPGAVITATARGARAEVVVAGCPVALESESGEGGLYLHYRNDCAQPLAARLALLGGLARP
ncbi:MAG: hypothetical protein IRY94_15390, partial [Rhodospirillaceae bacterium]|nr:hypothetical protein [Rhodospirillaceae bacterium]